jgi:hypothetical protein
MPPTPSFIKEVTVDIKTLLQTTTDPNHQADATRRDQAFEKAIRNRKIRILPRPQVADVLGNTTLQPTVGLGAAVEDDSGYESARSVETKSTPASVFRPPGGRNQIPTVRKSGTPRDIGKHTERIDRRDNLRKMEQELRGRTSIPKALKHALRKQDACLPPVDIYCIGAVGFYRTLIKPDVTPFITSLYEIDQIIEQKEIEAIQRESAQDELTNEELIA